MKKDPYSQTLAHVLQCAPQFHDRMSHFGLHKKHTSTFSNAKLNCSQHKTPYWHTIFGLMFLEMKYHVLIFHSSLTDSLDEVKIFITADDYFGGLHLLSSQLPTSQFDQPVRPKLWLKPNELQVLYNDTCV